MTLDEARTAVISIHAPRVGRDLQLQPPPMYGGGISIHAPRVGRDLWTRFRPLFGQISIHAPRVGRDQIRLKLLDGTSQFQSTRPVWGATINYLDINGVDKNISIHAPRVGRDSSSTRPTSSGAYFNPRAPCGARLCAHRHLVLLRLISIHAPRVGRDAKDV